MRSLPNISYRESGIVKDLDVLPRFMQLDLGVYAFISERSIAGDIRNYSGGGVRHSFRVLRPTVTELASIGFINVRQLGPSIEDIAPWHKAGHAIMVSVPQEPLVSKVEGDVENQRRLHLMFDLDPRLPTDIEALQPDVLKLEAFDRLANCLGRYILVPYNSIFVWPGGRFHRT